MKAEEVLERIARAAVGEVDPHPEDTAIMADAVQAALWELWNYKSLGRLSPTELVQLVFDITELEL